jgi:hypothetical protein
MLDVPKSFTDELDELEGTEEDFLCLCEAHGRHHISSDQRELAPIWCTNCRRLFDSDLTGSSRDCKLEINHK